MEAPLPEIRNVHFAAGAAPRVWHPAGRSVTAFFDNLSVFFPLGERFFIASVRAQLPRVTDPTLREAVRAFCGQEGVHGREHARYNERLAREGYPVAEMESRVDRLLRRAARRLPRRRQLAVTCGLEHLTALLAHFLLADDRLLVGAHPAMADLWRWHAAEENEHKAVAFDVFVAAGGTYRERASMMALASTIFVAKVLEHQVRMMKVDGTVTSAAEWAALGRFLFVEPGGLLRLVRPYFQYYRRDFHPDDIDASALLERWKRAYEARDREAA